jgi:hypothetical protein
MLCVPAMHALSEESAATAHQLVVRSGLAAQLRSLTDQVGSDIRQHGANVDANVVASLVDAATEAFRPDLLQRDITARVAKKLTLQDMRAALAWLDTDVGKRITHAEELSSSPDPQLMRAFAEGLKTKPLAATRAKTIAELISATGAVRSAATMAETMALGVALGLDSLQPRERRVGEAMLRSRVRQAMPPDKMQALFGEQMPIIFGFTYRDISDADLAAYVAFLKGVAGKRYQEGMNASFLESLTRASLRIGDLVGRKQRQAAL